MSERFKTIKKCNYFHDILQEKLNLDNAPTLKLEYVNDAIDLGKTLLPLLPKKEDLDFLKNIMDIDVFRVACACGDLGLIKAAYEQAKNEDPNFSLVDQIDDPSEIAQYIRIAWVERHSDVVDWLLNVIKTETDDEDIHYASIASAIYIIIQEKRCDEFTYLWRQFSNTEKQRFGESLIEQPSVDLCSYLALTDRNTLDELVKLAALEDEEDPSQAFIFSLFRIGFQSKSPSFVCNFCRQC